MGCNGGVVPGNCGGGISGWSGGVVPGSCGVPGCCGGGRSGCNGGVVPGNCGAGVPGEPGNVGDPGGCGCGAGRGCARQMLEAKTIGVKIKNKVFIIFPLCDWFRNLFPVDF